MCVKQVHRFSWLVMQILDASRCFWLNKQPQMQKGSIDILLDGVGALDGLNADASCKPPLAQGLGQHRRLVVMCYDNLASTLGPGFAIRLHGERPVGDYLDHLALRQPFTALTQMALYLA